MRQGVFAGRGRALVDPTLAAAVAGLGTAEVLVPFSSRQGNGSAAWSCVAVLCVCAPLAVRRRHPFGAPVAVMLLVALTAALGPVYVLFYGTFVPLALGTYTAARSATGRRPVYAAAVMAGVLVGADLTVPELQETGEIAFHWTVFALVWTAGVGLRRHERRAAENLRRAVAVEVEAAERAMTAVADERGRIARELHDVVAHAVSVMVVQAGAAEQVVLDDPQRAREALRAIRTTGADALTEMRVTLGTLRETDTGPLRPQPGLERLDDLVAEVRNAGIDAALSVSGTGRPLPLGVDVAAYRIVQEALTNTLKHAGPVRTRVAVRYGGAELELEISDDGAPGAVPAASGGAGGGQGLVGMRERVALYGGDLEAARRPEGGFVVRASLPLAQP